MLRTIASATSVENLRKEAKRWLGALRAHDAEARARLERAWPGAPASPVLRDVQHALALEHGCTSWIALARAAAPHAYQRVADDLLLAFNERSEAALQRLNAHYRRAHTFDDLAADIWRRVYSFRERRADPDNALRPDEAQTLVAQDVGFASWDALLRASTTGAKQVPPHLVDEENRVAPARQLRDAEWDAFIEAVSHRHVTAVGGGGWMTDAVLARIADLDHVTALSIDGSRQITDEGLRHLARMPQLEYLNLTGGRLTDRGLEVLRHLPNLRRFEMTWTREVTDAGLSNLQSCDRLEHVDVMGTFTGDAVVEALLGKPALHVFKSGRQVTDAGLQLLGDIPLLKRYDAARPGELLIDGPVTNAGVASLRRLDGIAALDLFWHATAVTSAAFAPLVDLPHLASIGADGALSDDVAMRHYASMPRLRKLRAQDTPASDAGFAALARSTTLEQLWTGRDPIALADRGFAALTRMPALASLGVSCRNVSDAALASLTACAGLRELTSIDFTDSGFRHVGGCPRLTHLSCMYCRETTDAATEHVAALQLTSYYAGLTRITDRSLEILAGMASLEAVELYECAGITDAGLGFLARLPRLRDVRLSGLVGVTYEGTRVFPPGVRVRYVA
jgi:hypothetical protein